MCAASDGAWRFEGAMFALEVNFKGEGGASETIFVRRPSALISAREDAQVVIDDMRSLGYGLLLSREFGRRFCISLVAESESSYTPDFLAGAYDGEVVIDLGPIALRITALDNDLLTKEAEAPDRAGIRILRQACAGEAPLFPAVVVASNPPATISFSPDHPLLVGRSRQCTLRLDTPSTSSRHARIGFESGRFWVEDLGSTNGTFVDQQQISGRVDVAPGVPITLGREVTVVGVLSQGAIAEALRDPNKRAIKSEQSQRRYPLLISLSETARPAQLVITPGSSFVIGRDPSSDMWLGVPHVSRRHCTVESSVSGLVRITDTSTNGTSYDGGILRDDYTESSAEPICLDFGGGVTVGLCFSEEDEARFKESGGIPSTFLKQADTANQLGSDITNVGIKRPRSRTTFLRTPEELRLVAADVSRAGQLKLFMTRLSNKGRVALLGVVGGVLILTSLIVGSLVSGMK